MAEKLAKSSGEHHFDSLCQGCDKPFNRWHRRHAYCTTACYERYKPRPIMVVGKIDIKAESITTTSDHVTYMATLPAVEVYPVHTRGSWAVYGMPAIAGIVDERWEVHKNGEVNNRPFTTTDLQLAITVCDQFARELPT